MWCVWRGGLATRNGRFCMDRANRGCLVRDYPPAAWSLAGNSTIAVTNEHDRIVGEENHQMVTTTNLLLGCANEEKHMHPS